MLVIYIEKNILNGSLILLASMEQPGKGKIKLTESKLIKKHLPLMSQCPQFKKDRNLNPQWNQKDDTGQ